MNFKALADGRPEVVMDRHSLSFSRHHSTAVIADAFSRAGAVMLKGALPQEVLETSADAFRSFIQSSNAHRDRDGDLDSGGWYSPWLVRRGKDFPAADVLSAAIRSWLWDVVEEICRSSNIIVLLKFCTARHSLDKSLGVGAHQDAKVVAFDVPLAIWIPLQDIVPGRTSGLGFVVPAPHDLLPVLPNNDVGADYVLSDPARLWIPCYETGDLTIHSRFSAHFTTGYGTLTDRFSLEIRAMPRLGAPAEHSDPAIYVARRGGVPTIIEAKNSSGRGDVGDFLASFDRRSRR
jgi:hypothetical protein